MKTNLKLVQQLRHPQPYDETKGLRRIAALRSQLTAAAVRYVTEGTTETPQDRLRAVSDASGVSRAAIEVEMAKAKV